MRMSNRTRAKRGERGARRRQQNVSRPGTPGSERPAVNRFASEASLGAVVRRGMQNSVDWVDREPRQAVFFNVLTTGSQGIILGLLMGLFAGLVTSGFPKVWTYATNTFAVMLLRVVLQWLWVLLGTPLVYSLGRTLFRQKTGQEIPEGISQKPLGAEQSTRSTVPAIVSLAIATILTTEQVDPSWLNETWAIVVISALGGGGASLLEALAVPSNIYALRWNRHEYQETLSYQENTKRNGRTRQGQR